ncbi:MAG: chorismate mutase, partial [Methylophilaceae bacterium]
MTDLLKQFRNKIDAIDEQVLQLVNERAKLAREIGHVKEDGVIYRPEREAQVLRSMQAKNQGPLSNEAVSNIFRAVMSNCRALEKELSIVFLGPLGTYSEEAALKQFGLGRTAIVCGTIDEVFRTLMDMNWQPYIRTVPAYYDRPDYIKALAASVRTAYAKLNKKPDLLVTSYHGVPVRYVTEGD